jgi:cytidyltransferase-like protein
MKKNIKTVCVSGYFNPIHSGHISMFKEAKKLGNYLIVIINNDNQVKVKGSVPFMKVEERAEIIKNLRMVDQVVISIDKDKTVCKTLAKVCPDIFANGGDRKNPKDIPEAEVCDRLGIKMVFNVGGSKTQSSSTIIKKAVKYFMKK